MKSIQWNRVKAFAVSALLLCVALAPRAQARTYTSGEFGFDVGPAPSWVIARDIPAHWDPAAPGLKGTKWRNWLIDSQLDRRGAVTVEYHQNVYEPMTAEMIGEAAKFSIAFNPEYQKLVVHEVTLRREGKWLDRLAPDRITLARRETEFEKDMATGMVTALIVLDDVRVGDVVSIRYSVQGENPILGAFTHDEYYLAWVDPILDRRVRALFDARAELDIRRDGGAGKPRVRRVDGAQELTLDVHGVPATRNEGSAPAWYSPFPRLQVARRHRWAEVAAWARELYPPPAALPAELEARIATWRQLPDDDARIAAALRAVQEEVRYFGAEIGENTHRPAEPAQTWTQRRGDCKDKARLLTAVLARMDIAAHPALVSHERGRAVAQLPPSATAFDHVIVQVPRARGDLWLDATVTQQRGVVTRLEVGDFGFALPVADGVNDLVAVQRSPEARDRVRVTERLRPEEQGNGVTLDIISEYRDAAANRLRRLLAQTTREELERQYSEYYRRRFGDLDTRQAIDVKDDETDNLISVRESYALKEPWVARAGSERAIELYADSIGDDIALPETMDRAAPLALVHPVDVEQVFELQLPRGWRWLGQPEKTRIEDATLSYRGELAQDGTLLRVSHQYTSAADFVPVAAIDDHLKARRQIGDWLGKRLVVAVPAERADQDRDQRLKSLLRDLMDDKEQSRDPK